MKKLLSRVMKKQFTSLFVQERGAIAILTGIVLAVCIGFAGLAIDVGIWYTQKRKLQLAADAGAVGGAFALSTITSSINAYVPHDVNLNGCTGACTITGIHNPPTSGPNTANNQAVEVNLSQPATLYLAGLFLPSAPTLTARSVAQSPNVTNCLIALSPTGTGLNMRTGSSINAPNCEVYVDSNANNAITKAAGTTITAKKTSVVGNVTGAGTITPAPVTGVAVLADPYLSFTPAAFSGCNQNNFSVSVNTTINPGVYCNGLAISGTAVLTMNPGVYYIDRGTFNTKAGNTINGNGVTIILTSSTGSNYATVNFQAGLTTNLKAPTSGATAGMLLYAHRNSATGNTQLLMGGTNQILNGILYAPSTTIQYAGRATSSSCLQIVARLVDMRGPAALNNVCGTGAVGGHVKLIE